jgi:hypothetical protein
MNSSGIHAATAVPASPAESAVSGAPPLPSIAPTCENAGMRALALMTAMVIAGCATETGPFSASDEQFIETVVELRRAALEAGMDTAQYETLREAVLEERGVTEEDLRAYVARHSADLRHMATVWDTISARLSE